MSKYIYCQAFAENVSNGIIHSCFLWREIVQLTYHLIIFKRKLDWRFEYSQINIKIY